MSIKPTRWYPSDVMLLYVITSSWENVPNLNLKNEINWLFAVYLLAGYVTLRY